MHGAEDIEALLLKVALKDRAAFSSLYSATSAKLFGLCLRVLKDRAVAEEVLQEVFVKIWNRADRYKVTGHSPMTWLITLARNTAIDRYRAGKAGAQMTELEDAMPVVDTQAGPEAQLIAADEARRVVDCLGELPNERADAVRGAYLGGESYAELADRFGVPLNTMRTWLRRSLHSLKDCLSR